MKLSTKGFGFTFLFCFVFYKKESTSVNFLLPLVFTL